MKEVQSLQANQAETVITEVGSWLMRRLLTRGSTPWGASSCG